MSTSGILFLQLTLTSIAVRNMQVLMASENFLLQGIWKDEALVTNSSLIDNFTKQLYQLWRKFQRSPLGTKFDRRIQVKKQGISFEWKSTRDIISLSLILVPSRKCSFSLISKIHKDMDHLHISHLLQRRQSGLHPNCKRERILLGNWY